MTTHNTVSTKEQNKRK